MATQSKPKSEVPVTGINQNGTKTVFGVHFGNVPDLKMLSGDSNSPLFDKTRLSSSTDNRLTRRIYFFEKEENGPLPLMGTGKYAYVAGLNGIYNPDTATDAVKEEIANLMADTSTNEWESAILDAGYYGYIANGVICFLDGKVKVKFLGDTETAEKQSLDPTHTPTDLPVAPRAKKTSTKNLPKPRKQSKTKTDTQVSPTPQNSAVGAVNGSTEDSGVVGVSEPVKDIGDSIKSILLSESFTQNLSGKLSSAMNEFNSVAKKLDVTPEKEESAIGTPAADQPKKESNKVESLLDEIRQILMTMKEGNQKDIVLGQQRLEMIVSETKNFTPEIHQFFTESVNDILRGIESVPVKKTPSGIKKKPPTIRVGEELTKFDPLDRSPLNGIGPTETPTDFAVKPTPVILEKGELDPPSTKVDESAKPEREELPVKVVNTQPILVTLPSDKIVPKDESQKVPDPVEPTPVVPPVKPTPQEKPVFTKEKKRGLKDQNARVEKDDKGNITKYRPAYKESAENLSGFEKVLGAVISKNKNVKTRNVDGSYTQTPGANKIGYNKKILRSVDQYIGKGETAKALRKIGVGSRKNPNDVKTKAPSIKSGLMPVATAPIVGVPAPTIPKENDETTPEKSPEKGMLDKVLENVVKPGAIAAGLSKFRTLATKAAAPLAAAYSVGSGGMDELKGKRVESLTDIIPEGNFEKLNPFQYAMNAGRYVGNKQNQYYGAVSKFAGGSGSLGSDIYDLFNKDPLLEKPVESKKATIGATQTMPPVSKEQVARNLNEPAFTPAPKQEYVRNNDYLTDQAMKKETEKSMGDVVTAPPSVINQINNTSPTTQVMPNNAMTMRPMESAYSRYMNKRFAG